MWGGEIEYAGLGLTEDVYVTIPRGGYTKLAAKMDVLAQLAAPLVRGTTVGEVEISFDGAPLVEDPARRAHQRPRRRRVGAHARRAAATLGMSGADESLLKFPTDLPVKVFGRNDAEFRAAVVAIIEKHYGKAYTIAELQSKQAAYVSLTITVRAESRAQIDARLPRLRRERADPDGALKHERGRAARSGSWAAGRCRTFGPRCRRSRRSARAATRDEIWFVEHPPVYTLGMRADRSPSARARRHSRRADRPRRAGDVPRPRPAHRVRHAESRAARADAAQARASARERRHRHRRSATVWRPSRGATRPASTSPAPRSRPSGLRVKRHCSYHGLAVNVAMDLEPFRGINPCGYADLPVTDLRALAGIESIERFRADFEPRLLARLAPSC